MASHNNVHLYVHLVWRTWDSLPLIAPEAERGLHRAIEAEASKLKCRVFAVGGTADHVHLLVGIPSTLTAADLAKQVKGASSRLANESLLPGGFKWQGHYGAFSVSRWDVSRVCQYIERQQHHHASGELMAELEDSTIEE